MLLGLLNLNHHSKFLDLVTLSWLFLHQDDLALHHIVHNYLTFVYNFLSLGTWSPAPVSQHESPAMHTGGPV